MDKQELDIFTYVSPKGKRHNRLTRKEYQKKWRDLHNQEIKEYRKKWSAEHKEKIREYSKEYLKKYPERIKKYKIKIRKKLKNLIFTHYSSNPPKCACCGESHIDFLTLDHINGGGTEHRKLLYKQGTTIYLWIKKNNFPNGFQVLCMNCNWAKGHSKNHLCPHELEKNNGI